MPRRHLRKNGLKRPSVRKPHAVPTVAHGSSAHRIDHIRLIGGKEAALGGAAGRSGNIRAQDANALCLHPNIPGRCIRFFRRERTGSNSAVRSIAACIVFRNSITGVCESRMWLVRPGFLVRDPQSLRR